MRIPVFVSCPTSLNNDQELARTRVMDELELLRLESRALGRSDYPADLPLREVHVLATHCSGGIILGFEQFHATSGTLKRGTPDEKSLSGEVVYPSMWNQLEAGVLYGLGLPLLVFREEKIEGGIFDIGVTDVFVHKMPTAKTSSDELREIFLKWQARVREHYYRDRRQSAISCSR